MNTMSIDEQLKALAERERRRFEMIRPSPLEAAIDKAIAEEKERWAKIHAAHPNIADLVPRRRLVSKYPVPKLWTRPPAPRVDEGNQ